VTVYALAQLTIRDSARYARYASRFFEILRRHRGRLLASDERPTVLEGAWHHDKVVLLAFETKLALTAWAESEDYRMIAEDRHASTAGPVLLVHGVDEPKT
jgi:uncharacterized protein (DUF1330 family)